MRLQIAQQHEQEQTPGDLEIVYRLRHREFRQLQQAVQDVDKRLHKVMGAAAQPELQKHKRQIAVAQRQAERRLDQARTAFKHQRALQIEHERCERQKLQAQQRQLAMQQAQENQTPNAGASHVPALLALGRGRKQVSTPSYICMPMLKYILLQLMHSQYHSCYIIAMPWHQ